MKTLCERLNFSDSKDNDAAIKVSKLGDVNYYETLRMYCADNDIDLNDIDDNDFYSASITMRDYGKDVKATDSYFFWID